MKRILQQAAGWVVERELVWVLMLAPWLLFPDLLRVVTVPALLAVPLLWLVRPIARRPIHLSTPVNLPLLLLLLALGVAVGTGPHPDLALPDATAIILGVAVVSAFVNAGESWRGVQVWSVILTAAGFVLALIFLVTTDWPQGKIGALTRLSSSLAALGNTFGRGSMGGLDPEHVAGVLLLLLPIVLGFALHSLQRSRQPLMSHWQAFAGAGLMVALLILFVLVLTQSRTAFVVLIVVATIVLGFWWRPLSVLAVALFLTAAMLLLIGLLSGQLGEWVGMLDSVGRQPRIELGAWFQRVELWRNALLGLRDYPLTGAGPGAFMLVAPLNYPFDAVMPDSLPAGVPNLWLQAGVDLGVLGLTAFAWLTAMIVLIGWKIRLRRIGQRLLLTGFWLGLLAWMGHGLLSGVWLAERLGLMVWIAVGVLVGGWPGGGESLQVSQGGRRFLRAGWVVGGLVLAGVLGWLLVSPIWTLNRGAHLLDKAMIDGSLTEPERVRVLGEAQSLLSGSGDLPGAIRRRAVVEYELGNDTQAVVSFRRDAGAEAFLSSRGRWLLTNGQQKEAERLLGVAMAALPDSVRLSCLGGDVFQVGGNQLEALGQYRRGLELSAELADEPVVTAKCYDGLAILAESLGWWGEAAASLAKAVELEPENLGYQQRYGWALYKATGELAEPVAIEEALLRAEPDSMPVVLTLTDIYLEADRPRKALEWSEAAVLIDSSNAEAWLRLAMASRALDELDQARKALNEALRLDPAHPEALDLQARWSTP